MTSVRNGDTDPVRYLFATLLTYESEFYGRVAAELVARGNEAVFVTESGDSAQLLRGRGFEVYELPGRARTTVQAGQRLTVETPGGGGYGEPGCGPGAR